MTALLGSSKPGSFPVVGAIYNANAPAPQDGQSVPLQVDINGNLLVNIASGGSGGSNASVGLTGANVPASATYVAADNPSGKLTGLIVDASGNLLVNVAAGGGGGTQYADGTTQATPTGTVSLGKNPSNVLHALSLDASGNLNVNVNANSFGTFSVVGTKTNNNAAPGSNNVGALPALANASAPSWTEGDQVALSVDLFGNQRVKLANGSITAVTQSTSPWTIQGDTASGAANSGNPVKVGGVFNTSQPTVLTGQTVDASYTSRGAAIVAVGVDGFAVTVSSGTVAVTQSTTPWTIQGDSASGAANAGNPVKIGGVFNTTQPTVTTGQTVDVQTTARGAQIVAVGVDGFAVTLASTTITGTVAVTQSITPWTIQGDSASGAAKAGNPVQIGGVFNTTQPTVTTGQTVETQMTARGAQIVATGVDPFSVSLASTTVTGTVTVQGGAAADAAAVGNPVLIGGVDNAGNVQELPVADVAATTPTQTLIVGGVDGSAVTRQLPVSQNGATAPLSYVDIGGEYTNAVPVLSTGQGSSLQLDTTGGLYINAEGRKATYRAVALKFTPVSSASFPTFSIQGSATKTIRITQIRFSLYDVTGATTPATVVLQRFSSPTGQTVGTTPTIARLDGNDAVAGAVVVTYSTAPTATTSVTNIDAFDYQLTTPSATTAPVPPPYQVLFGSQPGAKEMVLRANDGSFLGIVINGVGTTPICSIMIEWTEETL